MSDKILLVSHFSASLWGMARLENQFSTEFEGLKHLKHLKPEVVLLLSQCLFFKCHYCSVTTLSF